MKFAELTFSRAGSLGRVMTSRAVSTYANQVIAFVIRWLVLSCTGSAWNAGVTAFTMGLASLVGILIAGLIIDRMGAGRCLSLPLA